MLNSLSRRMGFGKSVAMEEANLLLIGPPSCGKTAIIYFLYDFAMRHLRGYLSENANYQIPISTETDMIKQIDLSVFIDAILKETITTKDFVGTDPSSITLINFNSGKLILRIYNISGEIFSNLDTNRRILDQFAEHLEYIDVDKTYALLCDECSFGDTRNYGINFTRVSSYFNKEKAHNIFTNISRNINTLRIVTKFDLVHKPSPPESRVIDRNTNFNLMHGPLFLLNHHETHRFMDHHAIMYGFDHRDNSTFVGSRNLKYHKHFICTGLYDKINYSGSIYEPEPVTGKEVLKAGFRGNEMSKLGMYGILEIFSAILHNSPVFKKDAIFQLPTGYNGTHKISHADYKKIVGL
jgi:hypothetical protein